MKNGNIFSIRDFSVILKSRRKAQGFSSCSKLAKKLLSSNHFSNENCEAYIQSIETTRKKIERWENGLSEPSASEFKNLCDILECDPEYLWGICPTPLKETKTVMESTGLHVKIVERLIEEKKKCDKGESEYVNRSMLLDGLNILLKCDSFLEILPFVAEYYDYLYYSAVSYLYCQLVDEFDVFPSQDSASWRKRARDLGTIHEYKINSAFHVALTQIAAAAKKEGREDKAKSIYESLGVKIDLEKLNNQL